MSGKSLFHEEFEVCGGDFSSAGKSSIAIKSILRQIGVDPAIIRRVAIASYEAEMNIVVFARQGLLELSVTPDKVRLVAEDEGPGIPDVNRAMQEGYSTAPDEIREMGFGAGMGLPNIRKNADELSISSVVGQGTKVEIGIGL
jgi:anti-sigma regulatory factor (Ser/Thr protein kinase)